MSAAVPGVLAAVFYYVGITHGADPVQLFAASALLACVLSLARVVTILEHVWRLLEMETESRKRARRS